MGDHQARGCRVESLRLTEKEEDALEFLHTRVMSASCCDNENEIEITSEFQSNQGGLKCLKVENKIASAISRREFLSVTAAACSRRISRQLRSSCHAAPLQRPPLRLPPHPPRQSPTRPTSGWARSRPSRSGLTVRQGFYGACKCTGCQGRVPGTGRIRCGRTAQDPGGIDCPEACRHHDLPGRRSVPE